MANVQHSALTGSALHETKGVSTASDNTVHYATGGVGAWAKVNADMIDTSSIKNINKVYLTYLITDVCTAGSHWVVAPLAGTISKIYSVIDGAIGTADTALSFKIAGVAVTNGDITITQSGSAAGDVNSATPTANNTVTDGQAIEIITDGAGSNTVACTVTIEITCT